MTVLHKNEEHSSEEQSPKWETLTGHTHRDEGRGKWHSQQQAKSQLHSCILDIKTKFDNTKNAERTLN